MSVPRGKRSIGVFETGTKARDLAIHTLRITKNKEVFPARYQHTVTNRIINITLGVYGKVRRANSVFPTNLNEYQLRRKWQLEAYADTDELLGFIEVAHEMFSIDTDKVMYWTRINTLMNYSLMAGSVYHNRRCRNEK